jgi:hypothetical protein
MLAGVAITIGGFAALGAGPLRSVPPELSRYRTWRAGDVHAVSTPLAILCQALPEKELARRRAQVQREQGPHAERYLRVFHNPTASLVGGDSDAKYPVGSIIAKEKLADPYARRAEAVAFMIKHAPGYSAESGDWEFRYYPEPRGADYASCVECHRTGTSRDYVFSRPKGERSGR